METTDATDEGVEARSAIAPLRSEVAHLEQVFADLSPHAWSAESACRGWRVQDVVQHMASTFHFIGDPSTVVSGNGDDAEQNNEVPVEARRDWAPAQVLAEYREWSGKALVVLEKMQGERLRDRPLDLSNIGTHPMHLLANAMVFDHYCHLRHDMSAAVPAAGALPHDEDALRATLVWMFAGIPQMCRTALSACDQGVNLRLSGPGATSCTLRPGDPLWTVTPGCDDSLPTLDSTAHDFVSWGTKRSDWRASSALQGRGRVAAEATLDAINVI